MIPRCSSPGIADNIAVLGGKATEAEIVKMFHVAPKPLE
jgi:hypothetical protein